MPNPKSHSPGSISEYISLVSELQSKALGQLWFRGCGKSSYELLPGLYRHRRLKNINDVSRLERNLLGTFRQRSIPFHSRDLANDWDCLFFMQHYRVPTRLLDWTENPLIGLYFAVMSAPFKVSATGAFEFESPAAVWILDPTSWNRHALRHQSFSGGILTPDDEPLKGYQPVSDFSTMNNAPAAIYGAHNSPRIVAQRGVFTVFGQNSTPMEGLYSRERFPSSSLVKVIITKAKIAGFRNATLQCGITESVVFPDLDGLAKELRRLNDFED